MPGVGMGRGVGTQLARQAADDVKKRREELRRKREAEEQQANEDEAKSKQERAPNMPPHRQPPHRQPQHREPQHRELSASHEEKLSMMLDHNPAQTTGRGGGRPQTGQK